MHGVVCLGQWARVLDVEPMSSCGYASPTQRARVLEVHHEQAFMLGRRRSMGPSGECASCRFVCELVVRGDSGCCVGLCLCCGGRLSGAVDDVVAVPFGGVFGVVVWVTGGSFCCGWWVLWVCGGGHGFLVCVWWGRVGIVFSCRRGVVEFLRAGVLALVCGGLAGVCGGVDDQAWLPVWGCSAGLRDGSGGCRLDC